MKLYITYEEEERPDLDFDWEETASKIGEAVLKAEGFPGEAEVSLVLTSEEEIHRVNREFRGIDAPTDVLSFPMLEFEKESDFSHVEDSVEDCFDPETGELVLGDIIISVEKVMEQAEKYGHSRERELAFLLAHSMLHLCGYDHMDDAEREEMERRQDDILSGKGYHR